MSSLFGDQCEDKGMEAILHTTAGDITVELLPNHAPKTVKNFTGLATGERTPALGDVPYAVQMEPNLVVEYYAKN